MELGLIKKVDIDAEMQQSYLDYAMSVIVARALPDARDGLKPVQRRILYAMYDMGLRSDSAYKKSARIVGEVLGKYHPHGDMAVYEAMARMAQDFSMRYPLVDGQGNFGSVDGDPPAAMRYTEARLAPIALDLLNQIEKNTVDFARNFDDSLDEPVVLPAAIPNLIVNGATGIAVGMATNIPPHNLSEVIDALVFMLERWEQLDDIPIDALMKFIQGPDFPTGGVIIQDPQADGLSSAYASGRGRVIVQARARLEEMDRGRSRIIVTELPYTVNKASLIERIAELVREGTVEGISDLRDESDRHGMRIVIEVSKTADPQRVLRDLYHRTPMKTTFGINLLALVEGEPRLLSLKQALRVYLEHRLVVVKRRSEYDLAKAKQRAHILEGLRIALQHLDELIALIRGAADVDQARQRMMKRFKLSELQAQAILEMQLRRLAALERKKIEQDYKETIVLIKTLEALLRSPKRMRQAVIDELVAMKEQYGDRRRTQIAYLKEGETLTNLLTTTDLTPAQDVWISITESGRMTRTLDEQIPAMDGQDGPRWFMRTSTHALIYLVSTNGRAAALPVHVIPDQVAQPNGVFVHQLTPLKEDDPLAFVFQLPAGIELKDEDFLITISRQGLVKKSLLSELPGPAAQAFQAARVNQGDSLGWGLLTHGRGEILLATRHGMAIRFLETEVRPMGLVAAGVGGIKLANGDEIVGAVEPQKDQEILLIASDGRAKRVPLHDFPMQSRYGQGVIAWKLARGLELAGIGTGTSSAHFVVHLSKGGSQQVRISDAAPATRAGQGKSLVDVKVGDHLLELVPIHQASEGKASPPLSGRQRRKPKASSNGYEAKHELAPLPRPREKSKNELKGKAEKPGAPSTKDGKGTSKTSRYTKTSTSSSAKPSRKAPIQAKAATKSSDTKPPKSTRKSKSVSGETKKPKAQLTSTSKGVTVVPKSKTPNIKVADVSSLDNKKKTPSSRKKIAQPELPGLADRSYPVKSTPRSKKKKTVPGETPPAPKSKPGKKPS